MVRQLTTIKTASTPSGRLPPIGRIVLPGRRAASIRTPSLVGGRSHHPNSITNLEWASVRECPLRDGPSRFLPWGQTARVGARIGPSRGIPRASTRGTVGRIRLSSSLASGSSAATAAVGCSTLAAAPAPFCSSSRRSSSTPSEWTLSPTCSARPRGPCENRASRTSSGSGAAQVNFRHWSPLSAASTLVTIGTAFHFMEPAATLGELQRMAAGGVVAVAYNGTPMWLHPDPWAKALRRVLEDRLGPLSDADFTAEALLAAEGAMKAIGYTADRAVGTNVRRDDRRRLRHRAHPLRDLGRPDSTCSETELRARRLISNQDTRTLRTRRRASKRPRRHRPPARPSAEIGG